jgi:4-hydroxy-2-oxoheptanedioate aldolase
MVSIAKEELLPLTLKAKLNGGVVFGTCIISTSPHFLRPTQASGVDFVFLDTEHISIEREKLSWLCQSYGALGMTPIVRVPEPDPYKVCCALDGGAVGIVAPYIETVAEVKALIGAVKLRPFKGDKLEKILQALNPSQGPESLYETVKSIHGQAVADFMKQKNGNTLLFINIESQKAIDNMDDLVGLPGVDGVFIGPADLSVQLGVPRQWENPLLLDTIASIIERTRSLKKHIGCHWGFVNAKKNQVKWVLEHGADIVIHASDLVLYANALSADMQTIRDGISGNESGATSIDASTC